MNKQNWFKGGKMKWKMWNFILNLVDVFIGFWWLKALPLIITRVPFYKCQCNSSPFISFFFARLGSARLHGSHTLHIGIFTDNKKKQKIEEIGFATTRFSRLCENLPSQPTPTPTPAMSTVADWPIRRHNNNHIHTPC